MLYELGQHIRILRLLGGAASQPFLNISDWKSFLFTLFENLSCLQCFEAALDLGQLMPAESLQSQHEDSRNSCESIIVRKFWHLYVAVDRLSLTVKGVLRSREDVALLRNVCTK